MQQTQLLQASTRNHRDATLCIAATISHDATLCTAATISHDATLCIAAKIYHDAMLCTAATISHAAFVNQLIPFYLDVHDGTGWGALFAVLNPDFSEIAECRWMDLEEYAAIVSLARAYRSYPRTYRARAHTCIQMRHNNNNTVV